MFKYKTDDLNSLLKSDFYKQVHYNQYPEGITKVVSYFIPRGTRIPEWNYMTAFGLQGFIKSFLIEDFNKNFFNRPLEDVLEEYHHIMDYTLGKGLYGIERVEALHKLGYLPIEIKALPEGTKVPLKCPVFEISNTHPDFAWLTNALESVISAELWHPMLTANVGVEYRKIVDEWYDKTCDDNIPRRRALGNFDMRGDEGAVEAYKVGAAWCLSFVNTATVPTIWYLEKYYNCDCQTEEVGFGAPSTEHSVMCSNYAIDGDEITMVKRLLTKIYPNNTFTMVSDSYDYWNMVDNIIPQCKEEIMNHKGCFMVRGDSGDPVHVVTETVFHLWKTFGGTVNSKGYKVLDPHVKAIYGDSITIRRCKQIYEILARNGFAASNVALGVGSFSMECYEQEDAYGNVTLSPFTRDTLNVAIKATYCEDKDGKEIPIFKNPKEMAFKKSNKGCIVVHEVNGELTVIDGLGWKEAQADQDNKLDLVFKDGKMIKEESLAEIRKRLHPNF